MEIKKITSEEFQGIISNGTRRAPYGQNQALLKKAEAEPCALKFDTEKKAVSKLTALYVVRRKMNAQVKIVRRGDTLYVGPGDYIPSLRKGRK